MVIGILFLHRKYLIDENYGRNPDAIHNHRIGLNSHAIVLLLRSFCFGCSNKNHRLDHMHTQRKTCTTHMNIEQGNKKAKYNLLKQAQQ